MDKEYAQILAKIRLDRAAELLLEAQGLLDKGAYKSANNRAFYDIDMEKHKNKTINPI